MQQAAQKMGKSDRCVAALVYVYDHAARDLSRRLVENYKKEGASHKKSGHRHA